MDKSKWTYKKLGEVATVVSGSTPKTQIEEYWNGVHFWITPAELDGSTYVSKSDRKITDLAIDKTNLTLMPAGTVLLSSRAPIGKVAITTVPMFCNQGFKNLICSDSVKNKYLYWFLKGKTAYLNSLGRGATFKEISKTIVENIGIPIYPIEEQQSIVSELDKINELISLKKAQLSDLDSLAQSIFYDMFGDPIENEKGWEVKKLGEVSVFPTKRINILHLNPSQYVGVENLLKDKRGVEFSKSLPNADKAIEFVTDDILIGNIRPYLRKIWISDINGGASGDVIIVRNNSHSIIPTYLFKVLSTESFFEYDNANTHGAKMPRGDRKMIELFPIPLPPLSLQQDFAKRIELIEQQKAQISSAIKDLETLLASRMQYWFD